MPSYTLKYFNGRGRAEIIRMLFVLKGQEFTDYRFKEGEWPTVKGNAEDFPLGQVPVLVVDGKVVSQSRAIAQRLARDFHLYGANNDEATMIDILQDTVQDISTKIGPLMFEKDQAKKAEGITKAKETVKPFLTFINNKFKEAGGRFFVGNSESLGDLVVYSLLDAVYALLGEDYVKANYPDLVRFRDGFTNNSKLSAYIKGRPQTPF